ncbi:DUF3793 family protein [Tepidibacter thalassicus]|uniref:DUF3793 family protein n=1 Tax=Tepidibacter thalassicus DSM 15285 TaxID=1123350 RepID=A0A1M5P1A8_9FIRM|nr:DUF3793 family protein [Tepidibacter thalassicus]SHG95497.1 Protein of unknown function [Tepidibacter thalassicus DSM 15285]
MNKNLNNCFCFNNANDNFIKWIIELLGPVILSAKPAEIVSFPNKEKLSMSKINQVKHIISKTNKILFREFSYCNKCTKMFFYNPILLDNTLNEHRNLKFLKSIGYPNEYSLNKYLDYIIDKMKSGNIPDEIGVFLGYPLKDVIGFIGHPSLKLTKINGWRVYGDSRLSDKRYMEFLNARKQMKKLLEIGNPENILLLA